MFRSLGFGIPPLAFPGGIGVPAIPFVKFLKHRGYARLQLVGHDRAGVHLFETPPVLGRASFEIYGFLFLAVRRNDIYPGEGFRLSVD